MSEPIIKIENIGKKYSLGTKEPYYSLRDSIAEFFTKKKKLKEEFWALRNVGFEIGRGETVGIIGRNGAGKSTLLKILSRITPPTEGKIEMRGRVASLLEVGTGFNPELTGRENIYLNGAILGMTKKEIDSKFHEIVAFSEVEKFLDTPVKRYSSGMYVRLAFAVAAHLEPEILIVDEVLAVGDAQFQKKCLGKMGDVAKSGRTVLFVSHNMVAIEKICQKVILLEQGRLVEQGDPTSIIEKYLHRNEQDEIRWTIGEQPKSDVYFTRIYLVDDNGEEIRKITTASNVSVVMDFNLEKSHKNTQLSMGILNEFEEVIFSSNIADWGFEFPKEEGVYSAKVTMPDGMFFPKKYIVRTGIWTPEEGTLDTKDALSFIPEEISSLCNSTQGGRSGMIAIKCKWDLTIIK